MDVLQNPIILAVIVIALLAAVGALLVIRRRRTARDEALPPPEIGESIDYTSLPYEEPTGLADRFRNASPAVKALLVLVPLVIIGVLAALVLSLSQPGSSVGDTPLGPPPAITNVTAEVAGQGKIVVRGETTLPDGELVTATMRQGEEEFAWFDTETAQVAASSGRITLTLDRADGAPTPEEGQTYTVVLSSGPVVSEPAPLIVLPTFASDFYQATVAAAPTATATIEPAPTESSATAAPTEEAAPEDPAAPVTVPATVRNDGNIRQAPNLEGAVIGQVAGGEEVTLLAASPDGQWYFLQAADVQGWVSGTLLELDEVAVAALPQQTPAVSATGEVFNGGNVRAAPNLQGEVLDQINAGETVQLLALNSGGTWYQITNIRGVTGWVSATLLTVSLEARRGLPVTDDPAGVASGAVPVPTVAPESGTATVPTAGVASGTATVPESTGLTALVFNGGNVRAAPNLQGEVLDQINAGETVQLLAKNSAGDWYQITNEREVTGWVNRTLLTVDPEVARRVPVGE